MSRILIICGILLILIGMAWPWILRLGLFRLPGDIVIEREGVHFYFPVTTSILISIVLSIIFWLIRK